MKKSNKGFTLIELLAVIVVLAVIALIATPIVLRLVDEAREGAAESSATAYVKAVENAILQKMVQETDTTFCDEYKVSSDAKSVTAVVAEGETDAQCKAESLPVDVKGDLPDSGTIQIIDGSVETASFKFGDYTINYANGQSQRS